MKIELVQDSADAYAILTSAGGAAEGLTRADLTRLRDLLDAVLGDEPPPPLWRGTFPDGRRTVAALGPDAGPAVALDDEHAELYAPGVSSWRLPARHLRALSAVLRDAAGLAGRRELPAAA